MFLGTDFASFNAVFTKIKVLKLKNSIQNIKNINKIVGFLVNKWLKIT